MSENDGIYSCLRTDCSNNIGDYCALIWDKPPGEPCPNFESDDSIMMLAKTIQAIEDISKNR